MKYLPWKSQTSILSEARTPEAKALQRRGIRRNIRY